MMVHVIEDGSESDCFPVNNGTKQGCVLAPTLFSILLSVMLMDAFCDEYRKVCIQFIINGGVFNSRRFGSRKLISESQVREFLYAEDCALFAHSFDDIQCIVNRLADSAICFGLGISLKMTEVIFQPHPFSTLKPPPVMIDKNKLSYVDNFTYLRSKMSNGATIDVEVSHHIFQANSGFGKLSQKLWKRHDIRINIKIAVYKAVVLSILLYGCET